MNTAVELSNFTDYKVADINLAGWGRRELDIAESEMPALIALRDNIKMIYWLSMQKYPLSHLSFVVLSLRVLFC